MKQIRLRKHYNTLTALERWALLYAAAERGDHAEVAALSASAPRVRVAMPTNFYIDEAYCETRNQYLIEVLDLAVSFVLRLGGDYHRKKEFRDTDRLMAYNLVVRFDSWREFCHDIGIDPRWAMLNPAGSIEALEIAERLARKIAFSENEARSALRKDYGSAADHIWTVETYTKVWRNLFDELVRQFAPVASAGRSSHRQANAPRRARR